MKILAFAASLRKDSLNRKLIAQAVEILQSTPSLVVDQADFHDFDMPLYDGDVEEKSGIPEGGKKFIERIQLADALIISTPEYNGGIPGTLKNAIDWASRAKPMPFSGKSLLLLGASPGWRGACRGLWHTRVPFEAVGAHVYPEMFELSKAHEAFDASGKFIDGKNRERLEKLMKAYLARLKV